MPERRRKRERSEGVHLELENRSELFDAFERNTMRVESGGEVENGRGKPRAIPCSVGNAQSLETKRRKKTNCGQQHNDRHGSLRRNRRADIFQKKRDTKRSEREDGPSNDGAILEPFGPAVDPGKDLQAEEKRSEREVDDENQVPGRPRPLQGRPDHRAERGNQIQKNVTENPDGVNSRQSREGWRIPFAPVCEPTRQRGQRQRKERRAQQGMRDAAMPGQNEHGIA